MFYDGDTFEHDGAKFRVTFPHDDCRGAPWEEYCGHGPVSEWTTRDKRPGEIVIASDHSSKRYYDFQEACKIARRDGWNAKPYDVPGETPRQRAAKAARADFEFLRRWCDDQWSYVGVIVTLLDDDGDAIDHASASVWGVESDCGDYLEETARELADEVMHDLQKTGFAA